MRAPGALIGDSLIEDIVTSSQIPSARRRREVARELRGHVEDLVLTARAAGHADDEIEKLVAERLGNPQQFGHNFAWVYRRDRTILAAYVFALSTLIVTILTMAGTLLAQAGVASSFGRPLRTVLSSHHTIIEAKDIFCTVAIYAGIALLRRRLGLSKTALAALSGFAIAIAIQSPFLIFGFAAGIFLHTIQIILKNPIARFGVVPACFAIAGVLLWARSPGFSAPATLTTWMVMGFGYQMMTYLAVRVERDLLHRLQQP